MKISKLDDDIPHMMEISKIKCSFYYDVYPLDVGINGITIEPYEIETEEDIIDFINKHDVKIFGLGSNYKSNFNNFEGKIEDYCVSRDINDYEIVLYWKQVKTFSSDVKTSNNSRCNYIIVFPSNKIMAKFKMLFL